MALDKFIGKWQEQSKEGFDEFADSMGVPAEQKAMYASARTELEYARDGSKWSLTIGVIGMPEVAQTYTFALGDTYPARDIDGSAMTSEIKANGAGFVEQHTFEKRPGLIMGITRELDGDSSMIVKSTCNDKVLTTRYSRI